MKNSRSFFKSLFSRKETFQPILSSTDTGYVNKNNQKNIGKTDISGNHYNQKFYRMECQDCKAKYFANGSDIWLKKCPACQGGKNSSTVMAEVIQAFKDTPIGTEFTRSEIISMVTKNFDRNESSIIPSDYCYNRLNNGINYEKTIHLFEYTATKQYRYLGINYPYTGKIYHKPKGSYEVCVGELINGRLALANTLPTSKEPTSTPTAKSTHTTKRDVSVSLRFKVFKRDNFKCCICGASPAKDPSVELHADHIIPWSKGGETKIENLQTLCSKCNLGKSDTI